MGPVQQVDIGALSTVAGRVEECASTIAKAQTDHGAHLAPAGALDGWATGPALGGGADAWAAFLRDLHGQVQTFADGIRTSAAEYRATDEAAAHRATGAYGRVPQ